MDSRGEKVFIRKLFGGDCMKNVFGYYAKPIQKGGNVCGYFLYRIKYTPIHKIKLQEMKFITPEKGKSIINYYYGGYPVFTEEKEFLKAFNQKFKTKYKAKV